MCLSLETAGKVFERLLPRCLPWEPLSYWTQKGALAPSLPAGQMVLNLIAQLLCLPEFNRNHPLTHPIHKAKVQSS